MLAYRPDLPVGVFIMKTSVSVFAFICFVSASTPALAAAATPEEAQRLTGVFQTYLGNEPGVVTVAPAGEAYDVTIDLAPLIARIKQPNCSAEISPFVMKLTDQGGGMWLVTQDSPLSYNAKVPGQLDMTVKAGAMKGSAVFDQNVSAFISSTNDIADFSIDETITTPEAQTTHVAYNIKAMHYETHPRQRVRRCLMEHFTGPCPGSRKPSSFPCRSRAACRWISPPPPRQAPKMEPSRA